MRLSHRGFQCPINFLPLQPGARRIQTCIAPVVPYHTCEKATRCVTGSFWLSSPTLVPRNSGWPLWSVGLLSSWIIRLSSPSLSPVADPEGPRCRDHDPSKLMTVWRKPVKVAVVVTQCFDAGSDNICGVFATRENNVQCSLLRELRRIWLSHSQPGMSDWVGVYWRFVRGLITAQKQNGRENAPKNAFRDPKMGKNDKSKSWIGSCLSLVMKWNARPTD